MKDIKPCPKCSGFMYAVRGMIVPGIVPSNPNKRDWFCGRCKYNERS